MYEFIRGPMAWASFSVLIAGTFFQAVRFVVLTRGVEPFRLRPGDRPDKTARSFRQRLPKIAAFLRVMMVGTHPVMLFVTVVFHLSIFLLPIFLMEHHILMDLLWGFSFCPYYFPERMAEVISIVIFACILFFILRRLLIRRVRAVTTQCDFYMLFLTAAPFVTGFLAVHDYYDYRTLIMLHILSVNAIMISLPFTKYIHMFFFFFNRFWINSETSFRQGSRSW